MPSYAIAYFDTDFSQTHLCKRIPFDYRYPNDRDFSAVGGRFLKSVVNRANQEYLDFFIIFSRISSFDLRKDGTFTKTEGQSRKTLVDFGVPETVFVNTTPILWINYPSDYRDHVFGRRHIPLALYGRISVYMVISFAYFTYCYRAFNTVAVKSDRAKIWIPACSWTDSHLDREKKKIMSPGFSETSLKETATERARKRGKRASRTGGCGRGWNGQ